MLLLRYCLFCKVFKDVHVWCVVLFWICKLDFAICIFVGYEQVCIYMKLYIKASCHENAFCIRPNQNVCSGLLPNQQSISTIPSLPSFILVQPKHDIEM